MRKLAKLAVLAILVTTPVLASAQVSLGARLGYGFAMGKIADEEGADLSDQISAQVPIQLDVGFRVTPALTLGGYVSFGAGILADDLECDECSARVYRLGLQLDYAFTGGSARPWIGAGIGYEWVRLQNDAMDIKISYSGFEFLNLQGGIDWKIGGSKFSMGPFAMLSVGRYSDASLESPEEDVDGDIENTALHQWLQIGVRGRFDL